MKKYQLNLHLFIFLFLLTTFFTACNKNSNSNVESYGLSNLPFLDNSETRSVCAENPTGEKGKGGMAIPNPSEEKPAQNAHAANNLGQGWKVKPFLRVNSGETITLMDVNGPAIIRHIWMVAGIDRNHVLRFYWDDEKTPSVEVPVPDFFAVGHEKFAPVNSAVVVNNPSNALNCFWTMPFRKHVKITFTNEGDKDLKLLAYQITYSTVPSLPKNTSYFHAQWRRIKNTKEQNPYIIVDGIKGEGRYVGTFLSWVQQTNKKWFGEGEIKFYIDGDKEFPTICGTGTEDYFLGSYGFPKVFSTAYAGSTLPAKDSDELPNLWSLYRWHIMDPICFKQNMKVTLQSLGWNEDNMYLKLNDDISSVAYWYQKEPHAPFPKFPSREERIPVKEEKKK